MKKLIVLSLILAGTVLMADLSILSYAQAPTKDDQPTFYRLVPGTYVNGWPRFTVTYPKDWVERHPMMLEVFRAESPPSALKSGMAVSVFQNPNPIDKLAEAVVLPYFRCPAITSSRDRRQKAYLHQSDEAFSTAGNG